MTGFFSSFQLPRRRSDPYAWIGFGKYLLKTWTHIIPAMFYVFVKIVSVDHRHSTTIHTPNLRDQGYHQYI